MSFHEYLSRNVVPPEASKWLEALVSHDEGKRLAACLAIDLRANALAANLVGSFLLLLDGEFSDGLAALRGFAAAITQDRDNLVCRSALKALPLQQDDNYARVVEIKSFTEFYIAPTYNFFPNAAGIQQVRRMIRRGLRLGSVRRVWRGGMPNVWITSAAELARLGKQSDPDHPGTVVNNALGLGFQDGGAPDGRPELLVVHYPLDVVIEAFQPTSLDSPWDSYHHLFVASGEKDGWGKTFSCTGEPPFCPERVHRALDTGLTDGFIVQYIGVSNVLTRDIVKLVEEALKRFESENN
jgi:hypothetical protein